MRRMLVTILSASLLLGVTAPRAMADSNPQVVPPFSHAFGATYPQLAGDWFTWSLEVPDRENVLFHPENCAVGQGGKIFFLPSSVSEGLEVDCEIPSGAAIMAHVGGTVTFVRDRDPDQVRDHLTRFVTKNLSVVRARVDGQRIKDLRTYMTVSDQFHVDIPPDAIFGLRPGPREAFAVGVFLLFRPLSPGSHTITLYDEFSNGFKAGVTVHVTVG